MTDIYVIRSNRNTGISVRITDKFHKETVASLFPGLTVNSFDVTSQMAKLSSIGAISYSKKEVTNGSEVGINTDLNNDGAKVIEHAEITKIDKDPIIEETPAGDSGKLDEEITETVTPDKGIVEDSDSSNNYSKSYKKSNKR